MIHLSMKNKIKIAIVILPLNTEITTKLYSSATISTPYLQKKNLSSLGLVLHQKKMRYRREMIDVTKRSYVVLLFASPVSEVITET